jgi:hypothetical protein
MEKFRLKWNEFETNMRESFRNLREEERLFDVTLATDDGQHIKAHKMILAAGSDFFSDIFLKSDHSNKLIYLKGISSAELENITDFLYNGEANVAQEELAQFLETAQELQVKGLQGYLQGIGKNESEKQKTGHPDTIENGTTFENNEDIFREESILDSLVELADSFDSSEGTLDTIDGKNAQLHTNTEIDLQIEQIIEKNEGLWKCKECGKTKAHKGHLKEHAEIHLEGISHVCHICRKAFRSRHTLRTHISHKHSELFSCDICGKSGMDRAAHNNHKRNNHRTLTVKQ